MPKSIYFLILVTALITSTKNAYSDQPNGEPWSENTWFEGEHEEVEDHNERLEALGLSGELGFYEWIVGEPEIDEEHETIYEAVESQENTRELVGVITGVF